ncbi:transmembrane 4 L6 family member 5-like [Tiliqua scincoides]|uniref:transmembrane 4 L6 family member 5-like n=1 Tax=Tiliqua scincoides TaxID=71010 RepID=UPI0034624CFA
MCTGTCSKVVGAALWPFALLCIVANILLAFPDWDTQYVHDWGKHLTPEVLYLGGLIGGGVMVLVPAVHIQATGRHGCCGNRCGMCISVLLAVVGVVGAAYAVGVSMLGLVHGPLCRYRLENGTLSDWERPFRTNPKEFSQESYLFEQELWDTCEDPPGVIRFNVILFSLILGAGVLELVLCLVQVLNGLFGCLCGTCKEEKATPVSSSTFASLGSKGLAPGGQAGCDQHRRGSQLLLWVGEEAQEGVRLVASSAGQGSVGSV